MKASATRRHGGSGQRGAAAACVLLAGLLAAGAPARAQSRPSDGGSRVQIYTCTDDRGNKITSDRPIPECTAKEQRVLNRDGSLKYVQPPTLTAEERAERDARERQAAQARAAQLELVRRDRNLVARYPNEQAHARAREAALDTVRLAIGASEKRLKELAAERKPLMDESEFYAGRPMPLKLRQQIDANDAATDAQRAAMATQQAELVRINGLYDAELERLRRLWAGAPAGSLGPLPTATAAASAPH